jgi:hypothetical protein
MPPAEGAEERARRRIQTVLRAGLVVAVISMASGTVVHLAAGDVDVHSAAPSDLVRGRLDAGTWLALLGIVVLAATPVLRVLALVVTWTAGGDRRYAAVAAVVAVILAVAALTGKG